jgi:carbohydrate-selective porin OprB
MPNDIHATSPSTLAHDIKRLEAEFTHGYRPRASVFYVSTTNENGDERLVKDVGTSNWGPHWTSVNDEFEAKLALNSHLTVMTKSGITPWTASASTPRVRWPSY